MFLFYNLWIHIYYILASHNLILTLLCLNEFHFYYLNNELNAILNSHIKKLQNIFYADFSFRTFYSALVSAHQTSYSFNTCNKQWPSEWSGGIIGDHTGITEHTSNRRLCVVLWPCSYRGNWILHLRKFPNVVRFMITSTWTSVSTEL